MIKTLEIIKDELGRASYQSGIYSTGERRNLSVQVIDSGTVIPKVSNDGVNFIDYTRFIDMSGATSSTLSTGIFFIPRDHFNYITFDVSGATPDTTIVLSAY